MAKVWVLDIDWDEWHLIEEEDEFEFFGIIKQKPKLEDEKNEFWK